MSGQVFNTIYGRNLMGEIKNIVQRPYLIVTMEDLWDKFKHNFDDGAVVEFVKTLEYDEMMKDIEKLPKFESIVGMGGGQAVDYAKMITWKSHKPLYQIPTALGTNAAFGHRAGIRFDSVVRYMAYAEPVVVYVDYDVIQQGPKHLNRSGVCDVLCYHNAIYDWKYAHDQGKCEKQWPWDPVWAAKSKAVFDTVVEAIDDIHELNEKGIHVLAEALRWGGATYHNNGWNTRHIEGTDHFLFYTLEYMTKKKFIHGQPVCLSIFTGALMQNNKPDWMLELIHRAGVDIRPEAMGLSWDEVFAALKYQREFVVKAGYWYTLANDFIVDDKFCNLVKDKVTALYGEWKPGSLSAP